MQEDFRVLGFLVFSYSLSLLLYRRIIFIQSYYLYSPLLSLFTLIIFIPLIIFIHPYYIYSPLLYLFNILYLFTLIIFIHPYYLSSSLFSVLNIINFIHPYYFYSIFYIYSPLLSLFTLSIFIHSFIFSHPYYLYSTLSSLFTLIIFIPSSESLVFRQLLYHYTLTHSFFFSLSRYCYPEMWVFLIIRPISAVSHICKISEWSFPWYIEHNLPFPVCFFAGHAFFMGAPTVRIFSRRIIEIET